MRNLKHTLPVILVVLAMVLTACTTPAAPAPTQAPAAAPTTAPAAPAPTTASEPTKAPEATVAPTEAAATPMPTPTENAAEAAARVAAESAKAAQAAQASGKTLIRWFVGLGTGTDAVQQAVQQEVVEDFNKSQDKIQLSIEVVPYNGGKDTLATMISSGNAPDIVGPVGWSGSNAFHGNWLDLAPYIKKANYDTSDFNAELMKFYVTDEGQVGLPFAVFPAMTFFQKKMFDEAGLNYPPTKYGEKYKLPDGAEVPWDWNTLAEIGRYLTVDANGEAAVTYAAGKFTKNDKFDKTKIVQYGFQPNFLVAYTFAGFWEAAPAYKEEGGKYVANIPDNWKAAWEYWWNGIFGDAPFIPSNTVYQAPDFGAGNPFNSGKVAMAVTHLWYTCCVADAGKDWEFGALPANPNDGKVHGRVDADTFRILKSTKNPDAAFEVLTYLVGKGNEKLNIGTKDKASAYGALPGRTSYQDAWLKAKAEQFPWVKNWDVVKAGLSYPDTPSSESWRPNFNEAWARGDVFGNLIQTDGKIDIKAEIEKFENDLTTIYNKK